MMKKSVKYVSLITPSYIEYLKTAHNGLGNSKPFIWFQATLGDKLYPNESINLLGTKTKTSLKGFDVGERYAFAVTMSDLAWSDNRTNQVILPFNCVRRHDQVKTKVHNMTGNGRHNITSKYQMCLILFLLIFISQ